MSATRIPRTLETSLAGIREMSTIATPPAERHPILTYVGAYDQKPVAIAAAIRRALLREGQVFYAHNRVADIKSVARRLRESVLEARIVVAHGQMTRTGWRKSIDRFWARDWDVLLRTTIVETGLDLERQYPERRSRRGAGPVADAPVARSGRSGSGTRLRVFTVSGGEAADGDRQ